MPTKTSKPKPAAFTQQPRIPLPGSDKAPMPQALPATTLLATPAPSRSQITVSVIVPPITPLPQAGTTRLTPAQFKKLHGPNPASLKLVTSFAAEFGLKATAPTPGRRTVHLTGSQAALAKAFAVTFTAHQVAGVTYRTRSGPILLPESLTGHVQAVLGLDNRPQAQPHFRIATPHATNTSYTPPQVAAFYGLPAGSTAKGQTIAILELGGGYRPADLTAYFKTLSLPAPTVTPISVDKGKNTPGTANGADGEVMLDIEVCASVAPGAAIVVYFAPNTDQGFIDAIATAVHDTKNKPSVLSISWGGPESTWTQQAVTALDQACQAAAALGVTITVAAGDNGSTDGVSGTASHVDFPASSPHVLACGGTTLRASANAITSETVWNEQAANEGATGGGVSTLFPLPTWQKSAKVPATSSKTGGRGVPDVSGNADPATGYTIRVDGQTTVIGGTSAVAPLWAALIAVANSQSKQSAGFLNPTLYTTPKSFRDITQGNNGAFKAATGWDPCTGLGTPNVPLLFAGRIGSRS